MRSKRISTSWLILALAGGGLVASAPAVAAAVATCQGQAVTIVAGDGSTVGTAGDDVILVEVPRNGSLDALAGNDLICLTDGARGQSRDPAYFVDAGPGSDTVVNLQSRANTSLSIVLGLGQDTFTGNDQAERVFAGGMIGTGVEDTEPDVISTGDGFDRVTSGSSVPGTVNNDVIDTGPGTDYVDFTGAMGPQGSLTNGPTPDQLGWTGNWTAADLSIDARARTATLAGNRVLQWTNIDDFYVTHASTTSLEFVGTDGRESLVLRGPARSRAGSIVIRMRGGKDEVTLGVRATGRAVVRGGRGSDALRGSVGDDRIFGGPGRDLLEGRRGDDLLRGGPGRDRAVGGPGRDRCRAEVRQHCEVR